VFRGQMSFAKHLSANAAPTLAAATGEVFFAGGADGFALPEDVRRNKNIMASEGSANSARGRRDYFAGLYMNCRKSITAESFHELHPTTLFSY
jgi:hypothetical protein